MANYYPSLYEITTNTEECLIGSILLESSLLNNQAIKEVMQIIEPYDFTGCVREHKPWQWVPIARIYFAMTKCELPPHRINVALQLANMNILQAKDVPLMDWCEIVTPCSLDYMHYAKAVKEYSIKRQVKHYAEKGNLKKVNELTMVKTRKGFEI